MIEFPNEKEIELLLKEAKKLKKEYKEDPNKSIESDARDLIILADEIIRLRKENHSLSNEVIHIYKKYVRYGLEDHKPDSRPILERAQS